MKQAINILVIVLIALSIAITNSCITTYDTINNRNFSNQYNPADRTMHPEYTIYKKSDSEVRLYFRFFPKELTYMTNDKDSAPQANASLFYRVTNSYTSIDIIDSLTTNYNFTGNPRSHMSGYIPISFPKEGKFIIEVFLTDKNIQQSVSTVIEYNNSKTDNSNNFMFLSQYGNTMFYPFFTPKDTFRIRSDAFSTKPIRISYYKPKTNRPLPPDIQKHTKTPPTLADSSWIVENPDTTLFSFTNEGIYYFSNNKSNGEGKTYACFNERFPYTKTPSKLLEALNYLCNTKEMDVLKSFASEKIAIDTFWLQSTNNLDKSRELIRVYYNRVQLANYYFSNFKEGWLTDRGMIYIVCGAPNIIKKTEEGEYWVYGKSANESTNFFFYRDKHPLFGIFFTLDRSDLYERMWFNAVTTWRDGRVFSLNP